MNIYHGPLVQVVLQQHNHMGKDNKWSEVQINVENMDFFLFLY